MQDEHQYHTHEIEEEQNKPANYYLPPVDTQTPKKGFKRPHSTPNMLST